MAFLVQVLVFSRIWAGITFAVDQDVNRGCAFLMAIVLGVAGCAIGTRTGELGSLPGGERLVTLVVTEDRTTVDRECPFALGPVLGCQTSRKVEVGGGVDAKVVKVVRYTDRLPSAFSFDIDLHELCHTVAALQPIKDPCHAGNGGVARIPRPSLAAH